MTAAETLREALGRLVEPWMDVLLDGLSPDALPPESMPARLVAVRPGGHLPSSPWDALFIRADGRTVHAARAEVARAAPGLRCGGVAAFVALGAAPADPAPLLGALAEIGSPVEALLLGDGNWLATVRKSDPGTQDLVGLRRCLRLLGRAPARLELLVADLGGRRAAERAPEGGWSVKERIGHLGDLDRDGWLAAIRHALGDGPPPPERAALPALVGSRDHNSRPLSELLVRFRHLRWLSQDHLDRLPESAWLRQGPGLDGAPSTIADMVRSWSREEHDALAAIQKLLP